MARATLADAHTVTLATGAVYRTKHVLVATGGRPVVPDIPGAELGITSNEMFGLRSQPKRLAIVGGGYVACEFAGIMNGLGTEVLQFYRGAQILRGFDDDIRDHVAEPCATAASFSRSSATSSASRRRATACASPSTTARRHAVDQVLFATGRSPNTAGLGLEALGVAVRADGAVEVDAGRRPPCPRSTPWATSPAATR